MIKKSDKNENRIIRHVRVRKNLVGLPTRPRLCVYRSLTEIYAQIIDDTIGTTLVSASSKEKAVKEQFKGKTKKEMANFVGELIAKRALEKNITEVVFDRGGNVYTGRIASLAEGARKQGLKF